MNKCNDEEDKTPDIPAQDDPLLNKMKLYFLSQYEPVNNYKEADITMSTNEIFEAFAKLYRNEVIFSRDALATWLHEKGFSFIDTGKMNLEWILKRQHTQ